MKVLLIDDHPLILSALQSVIEGLGSDTTVVGANSARAARETLKADAEFDLVLLDLHLGDADGFDLLAELCAAYPALPVVVLSASDRTSDVIRAIDTGAMGFVPKRASNETLFEALHMVMSGGIYVPPMTMGSEPASKPHGDTVPSVLRVVRETAQDSGFQKIECIYENKPGWKTSTEGITEMDKLPKAAREYLAFLEKESGARVGMVSTGPDRGHTIFVDEFAAAMKAATTQA